MCVHEQLSINENHGKFADSPHFCCIFTRHLDSLYKLAFLLTTSHSLAEQCTLASLEEALSVNRVPKSLAESWSKRAVIKNALRMAQRDSASEAILQRREAWKKFPERPLDAIISLLPLERFVFVLSVLEKISDSECSRLLGCLVSEIGPARIRALEHLSTSNTSAEEQLTDRTLSPVIARDSAVRESGKAQVRP